MSYYPIDDKLQEKIVRKLEFNDLYNPEGLYPHQEFVRRYLSPYTPYKGLLIFHSLGSGKSLICISIAVDHYLYDGKRCLIVTKGSSGRENFKREILHYYDMAKFSSKNYPEDTGKKIHPKTFSKIFSLNHYMALHNSISTMNDQDIEREFSNMIFVFDEIHNIRNLTVSRDGISRKRTTDLGDSHVYDSLKRIVRLAKNTKIILATATPMTNDIGQLTSTMELLTMDGDSYRGLISYNSEIKDKPTKIFHGVDGYLKDTKVYLSYMIDHQRDYHIREQSKGTPKDIYRTLTHVSLFAFPDGLYGRSMYEKGVMVPSKTSKEVVVSRSKTKKKITYTMYKVIELYRKYLVGDKLRSCSSKYWELMRILEGSSIGPIFVFVEEVRGSGLLLLANIFEAHGYELYIGQNLSTIGKGKRYTICVGDQTVSPNLEERLDGFNSSKNINGEYVRVLIGSKVVGESITLKNVRQFHVLTIHWNDSTIEQAVGRVVRSGSHNDLNENERKVDIYIHASVCKGDSGKIEGTDMYKLAICNEKQEEISKMEEKLKKSAIDRYITQEEPSGKYISSSDSSTFILHYMERYSNVLIPRLEEIFKELFHARDSVPIDEILGSIDEMYSKVLMELLCKIVSNNIRVLGKYLREDIGEFFLTDDPSIPFFFIRDRNEMEMDSTLVHRYDIPIYEGKSMIFNTVESMESIRGMSFIERISFVENYVERRKSRPNPIPDIFDVLFIEYKEKLYHIMCYRAPGEAYTAVLPIPKVDTLELRMRVLENSGWKYIEDANKEIKIVGKMEKKYENLMRNTDRREKVFLVISLIDENPRIRTRFLETTRKGSEDKRYIRKGRSLPSISKSTLAMLYGYISELFERRDIRKEPENHEYFSLGKELVETYGYSSVRRFAKSHPRAFHCFVVAMERDTISELVGKIVEIMVEERKYIFM